MFLGCQKIEYHAKHCSIDPQEKGISEDLTAVGKTSSYSCRTGIDYPKLRMEEDDFSGHHDVTGSISKYFYLGIFLGT